MFVGLYATGNGTRSTAPADEYGIVMGSSHQEPMLRAQKEWDRRHQKTLGSWNYARHPVVMENFWREGIARNKNFESSITLGLRGANDTEVAPGGPAANKALLEKIVDVQRKIIADEINPDVCKPVSAAATHGAKNRAQASGPPAWRWPVPAR